MSSKGSLASKWADVKDKSAFFSDCLALLNETSERAEVVEALKQVWVNVCSSSLTGRLVGQVMAEFHAWADTHIIKSAKQEKAMATWTLSVAEASLSSTKSKPEEKEKPVASAKEAVGGGGPSVEILLAKKKELESKKARAEAEMAKHESSKRKLDEELAELEPLLAAASKSVRSAWAIYKRDYLTGDQVDFLVKLGALDADEKVVAKVKQPDGVAKVLPPAVISKLVEHGVFF